MLDHPANQQLQPGLTPELCVRLVPKGWGKSVFLLCPALRKTTRPRTLVSIYKTKVECALPASSNAFS